VILGAALERVNTQKLKENRFTPDLGTLKEH